MPTRRNPRQNRATQCTSNTHTPFTGPQPHIHTQFPLLQHHPTPSCTHFKPPHTAVLTTKTTSHKCFPTHTNPPDTGTVKQIIHVYHTIAVHTAIQAATRPSHLVIKPHNVDTVHVFQIWRCVYVIKSPTCKVSSTYNTIIN